ncbi:adenylate cyclase [Haloechinothrix alba]|uniref:Adenylate cyclase n=1 Tax=Haloechinothrix alba TaxID=664784 RepID=A0A238YSM3_9PSEU|nr:adenylate/guanylate cyclase domain-containing protein [Haloechinothrix alba]SNR73439.1 adenylate cyclase [Haloechinothrix alba]
MLGWGARDDRVLRERPLGSWLLGSGEEHGRRVRLRVRFLLTGSLLAANAVGAAVAIALVTVVIPGPNVFVRDLLLVNFVAVPVYILTALIGGTTWGIVRGLRVLRWATDGAELDEYQRRATLRLPAELTFMQALAWLGGLVLFTVLYAFVQPEVVPKVALSIMLSGTVTCANAYLLSEFSLRPIAARVLAHGPTPRRLALGVTVRTLVFWGVGSGVPVVGLMVVALLTLFQPGVTQFQLVVTVLALGLVSLLSGFMLTVLSTRATTAPIRTVRAALARVERGDLDTEVVVFDGTELGELQSSVNRMVAGLRERERIRDLFGKHVGEEVARAALSRQLELGGEVRDVVVLFVDVTGSTQIAQTRPPTEVVEVLNRFFTVVVDEVHAHDGFVNKFQGDAALAIFGAPSPVDCASSKALAAARATIERLAAEVPEFAVGIGVAGGQAVAGNVGAESRLEYTVIGDPVNMAARLTELAKRLPVNVAAAMSVVERASERERRHWREHDVVALRGRATRTRVAVPSSGPPSSEALTPASSPDPTSAP